MRQVETGQEPGAQGQVVETAQQILERESREFISDWASFLDPAYQTSLPNLSVPVPLTERDGSQRATRWEVSILDEGTPTQRIKMVNGPINDREEYVVRDGKVFYTKIIGGTTKASTGFDESHPSFVSQRAALDKAIAIKNKLIPPILATPTGEFDLSKEEGKIAAIKAQLFRVDRILSLMRSHGINAEGLILDNHSLLRLPDDSKNDGSIDEVQIKNPWDSDVEHGNLHLPRIQAAIGIEMHNGSEIPLVEFYDSESEQANSDNNFESAYPQVVGLLDKLLRPIEARFPESPDTTITYS